MLFQHHFLQRRYSQTDVIILFINNLCGSSRFPPAMYFYLTLVTIGKHFYRHQCRFSEHLACSLPDRESGAGDGSLGPPCHPVTLPPPCNMSIVQPPCYETLTLPPPLQYISNPLDSDRFNTLTLYVPLALQHCRLTTCG